MESADYLRYLISELDYLGEIPEGTPSEVMPETDEEVECGEWRDHYAFAKKTCCPNSGEIGIDWHYGGKTYEEAVSALMDWMKAEWQ